MSLDFLTFPETEAEIVGRFFLTFVGKEAYFEYLLCVMCYMILLLIYYKMFDICHP